MNKVLLTLLAASAVTKSCSVNLGGPPATPPFGVSVPWVMQQNNEYCGPASILMWAMYDGVTGLTQTEIGTYIGASGATGASPGQITGGVIHFTRSGRDASLDYAGGDSDEIGLYYSAEVTSVYNEVPFISIIQNGLHSGVASGGSYHVDASTGYYVWDGVVFQDPLAGPNQVYTAAVWTAEDIGHIVSASASEEAAANYAHFGSLVQIRGVNGQLGPLPD